MRSKNYHLLVSLMALFILIHPIFVSADTPDAEATPPTDLAGYIGVGLLSATEDEPRRTYQVEAETSFYGQVSIDNQTRATDYLLTCVLDYQQIPCLWEDETEPAYHYSVSLSAGQIRNIGFKTPEITEGAHDFVVLAFRNAFSTKLDYEYRISTDFNYFHAPRIVLLAGDSTEFPELPDSSLITGEPDILPMPLDGLLVTQSSSVDRISAWLMQPASPDEIFDYTIYLGNYSRPEDTRHYAVMSFLNYRQVPLSEQQDVMFANLDFLEQTTFEASVQAPADEGIYELVVIYATDPYTMLENPPTGETRELVPVNRNLYSSIRTAIVVEEQD